MANLIKINDITDIHIVNNIFEFNTPSCIYLPLKSSTLRVNDYVNKNTYLDGYITSISGRINDIKKVLFNNKYVNAIEIINDYKENTSKKRKDKINNIDDLIKKLDSINLNNIKNKIVDKKIENLIISSIDGEDYSLKEFFRLSNNYKEILDTIDDLINIFNLKNAILATKNTNFSSIKNIKSIIGTYPNIEAALLPNKYLLSYSNYLCNYLNKEPYNTLVLKTNEIYNIYLALNNKQIEDTLITISGNAIKKSMVIRVKLYTKLQEVIEEFINIVDNNYEVYLNGYLRGRKVIDYQNLIITMETHSIIINKTIDGDVTECINCGACRNICPIKINVKKCYELKHKTQRCIGCGLCNYICPAKIDLKSVVWSDNNEEL